MDNSRVIDIIQYKENIDEILEVILNKLNIKIEQLSGDSQTRMKFDDEEEYRKSIHELRTKLYTRFEELDSEEWHNL